MQTISTSTPRLMLALRIAAAVFGGYVLCWGFIALSTAGLYAAGSAFHDAEHLASILAFLIYPGAFCWAFCTRAPVRTALLLVGGGAAMTVVASLLQSHLVG